ncbi:uncharacterized protein BJX67DRAFT_352410 [Aspergillus lucknowensis]|uniref:Uncharacterized protein n=1 Tax=Aspergillus lucknowensis TaxID=176173 RepID=A0ABR4LTI9_9EURO
MQADFEVSTNGPSIEEQKRRLMQEMDERIVQFMNRYSWAFTLENRRGGYPHILRLLQSDSIHTPKRCRL